MRSLVGYRAFRWGRHVELLLTDHRSYRSEDYTFSPEAKPLTSTVFPQMVPFETLRAIDAGRSGNGSAPLDRLVYAEGDGPNFRKAAQPRSLLGAEQKTWLLDRLSRSVATWKIWADTVATLDMRADPQNLPPGLTRSWPGAGYAGFARTDHSTAFHERAQIYDHVSAGHVTGFAVLSGDRHSFWAGYAAKALPPERFEPVGVAFVGGSISSPGFAESLEHTFPREHPLRPLYLTDRVGRSKPAPAINLLLKHGVRTCLDYARTGDLANAKQLSNPNNAPHVEFVDMNGHGYGIVEAGASDLEVVFVCMPRPVAAVAAADGGEVTYRIVHRTRLWRPGETPVLERSRLEGDAGVSA